MKQSLFLLFALLFFAGAIDARTNIPLVKDVPSSTNNDDRARDPFPAPMAYLDDDILSVSLTYVVPITVKVTKDGNDVFLKEFSPANENSVNLEENGIREGNYQLSVYYCDSWWNGDFAVEEKKPAPTANGTIVEKDSVFYQLRGTNAVIVPANYADPALLYRSVAHKITYPDTLVIPSQITYEGVSYNVIGIDKHGLGFCSSSSIVLPNTIEFIDFAAFCECMNIKYFKIPDSLTDEENVGEFNNKKRMGECVFGMCTSLISVELPEGITEIPDGCFSDCTSLSSVTLPNSVTRIGDKAFRYCNSLSSIVIPEGVSIIDKGAFYGCSALESVVIPEGVSTLGVAAFGECTSLRSIKLPNSINVIEESCFSGCSSLESIVIPKGVEVISYGSFIGCTSLSSIVLPESITKIELCAFRYIADSAHIYCYAKEPPTVVEKEPITIVIGKITEVHDYNAFDKFNAIIHVPQGCKEIYQENGYWKNFTTIIDDITVSVSSDETGIINVQSEDAISSERFYDLQGRLSDGTKKGILIRNGKKILIK